MILREARRATDTRKIAFDSPFAQTTPIYTWLACDDIQATGTGTLSSHTSELVLLSYVQVKEAIAHAPIAQTLQPRKVTGDPKL